MVEEDCEKALREHEERIHKGMKVVFGAIIRGRPEFADKVIQQLNEMAEQPKEDKTTST